MVTFEQRLEGDERVNDKWKANAKTLCFNRIVLAAIENRL